VVICLERGADLHTAQLMPLPLSLVLPFWYWPTRLVLEKGPLDRCVCAVLELMMCAGCPSCHPIKSVKAVMRTQTTDFISCNWVLITLSLMPVSVQ